MIEFQYNLPRYCIDGKQNGQYNNPELLVPGLLTTKDYRLGEFIHVLHNIVADERRLLFVDGQVVSCCHNWIRDHVHMMKAFKHWDYNLKSFLEFIIDRQTKEGYFSNLSSSSTINTGHMSMRIAVLFTRQTALLWFDLK